MAITGAHVLLYAPAAERPRQALVGLAGWDHVDAGGGWLIFALPPAELGVHPADARGVGFHGEIEDRRFGVGITMVLPGELELLLYEPRHPTAI